MESSEPPSGREQQPPSYPSWQGDSSYSGAGQPPYGTQSYPYQQAAHSYQKTNGFAIASLVCGILGAVVGSILAVIFGYIAKSQIEQSNGAETGRGLAIAGIILGWIGVAFTLLGIIALIIILVVDPSVLQSSSISID